MSRGFQKFIKAVFCMFPLLAACGRVGEKSQNGTAGSAVHTGHPEATQEEVPKTLVPFENPEANFLLVEQAVDAWLYFHLSDYKSYEPLLRSTSYDAGRDLYLHRLRYRHVTPEGGPVTTEADFEVDLTRPGSDGNPFHVRLLTTKTL